MSLDPTRSTAMGYWHFSAQYLHAARAVHTARGRHSMMPVLQLYGQAIELALKAFLLKRGVSLRQLKRMAHGLTEILALARRRKLGLEVRLTRHDVELLRLLDASYAKHRFRYIVVGFTQLPELDAIADICSRLVGGLERHCTSIGGAAKKTVNQSLEPTRVDKPPLGAPLQH